MAVSGTTQPPAECRRTCPQVRGQQTAAALAATGAEHADMKLQALRHVGTAAAEIDRERVEDEAREALLEKIMEILDE